MIKRLKKFIKDNNIETCNGKLVLYKAVSREWGSLWVRNNAYLEYSNAERGTYDAYLPSTEVRTDHWDPNPDWICTSGLHVCALAEAIKFLDPLTYFAVGDTRRRLIMVLVDPDDVVAVPFYSAKIRCKRLVVVGEVTKGGKLRTRG